MERAAFTQGQIDRLAGVLVRERLTLGDLEKPATRAHVAEDAKVSESALAHLVTISGNSPEARKLLDVDATGESRQVAVRRGMAAIRTVNLLAEQNRAVHTKKLEGFAPTLSGLRASLDRSALPAEPRQELGLALDAIASAPDGRNEKLSRAFARIDPTREYFNVYHSDAAIRRGGNRTTSVDASSSSRSGGAPEIDRICVRSVLHCGGDDDQGAELKLTRVDNGWLERRVTFDAKGGSFELSLLGLDGSRSPIKTLPLRHGDSLAAREHHDALEEQALRDTTLRVR